jgi:hypothetical protein
MELAPMTAAEWQASDDPNRMLEYLRGKVVATGRKVQLFGCACARRVWEHVPQGLPREAIERSEGWADGVSRTDDETFLTQLHALWVARPDQTKNSPAYWGLDVAYWCREQNPTTVQDYVLRAPGIVASILVLKQVGKNYFKDHVPELTDPVWDRERCYLADVLRDLIPVPFARKRTRVSSTWLTSTVVALARGIYEERAFDRMPILADALQDAGCERRRPRPLPGHWTACSRLLGGGLTSWQSVASANPAAAPNPAM